MSEATMSDTQQWHEVLHIDDLWEGEMEAVDVAGTSVLLVNLDGEIVAYRNKCPHQDWPLNDGDLDGEKLTCAQHLWEMDVTTGRGINPATSVMVRYSARVDDEGAIFVSLEES